MMSYVSVIEARFKVNVSRCVLPRHVTHDADINPRCNEVTRLSELNFFNSFQRLALRLRHIHVKRGDTDVYMPISLNFH